MADLATTNPIQRAGATEAVEDLEATFEHGAASAKPSFARAKEFMRSCYPHRVRDDKAPSGYRMRRRGEEGGELYPVGATNLKTLGDFGIGVGLYFYSLLGWGGMLLLCGLISLGVITKNYDHQLEVQRNTSQPLPLLAMGSFAMSTSFDGEQAGYDMICCGLLVMYALVADRVQDKKVMQIDIARQTAQDYSVVVTDPLRSVKDPDTYRQYFSRFGEVVAVTIALNNGPLMKLMAAKFKAEKALRYVVVSDRHRGKASAPADNEHVQRPGCIGRMLQSAGIGQNRTYWEDRIQALEAKIAPYFAENAPEFSPCRVFITFNTEHAQRMCLSAYNKGLLERLRLPVSMDDRHVKEAPEPSDIMWENLHVSYLRRTMQEVGSYVGSFVAMVVSFLILHALASDPKDTSDVTLSLDYAVAVTSAGFVSVLNLFLPMFMKALVNFFESHQTYSSFQVSMMTKLVMLRFVNSAILTFLVTPNNAFLTTETISKVLNILVIDLIFTCTVRVVDPGTRFTRYVLGRKALTQDKLNDYFRGVLWNLGERYTDMFKTLFVCLFYSAIAPTAYFVASVSFFALFTVDKYLLLRHWAVAPEMDDSLSIASRKFFALSVAAHMWVTRWFYGHWPFVQLSPVRSKFDPYPVIQDEEQQAYVETYLAFSILFTLYLAWRVFGLALRNLYFRLVQPKEDFTGDAQEHRYLDCKGIQHYRPHAQGLMPQDVDLGQHASIVKLYFDLAVIAPDASQGQAAMMEFLSGGGGWSFGYGGFYDNPYQYAPAPQWQPMAPYGHAPYGHAPPGHAPPGVAYPAAHPPASYPQAAYPAAQPPTAAPYPQDQATGSNPYQAPAGPYPAPQPHPHPMYPQHLPPPPPPQQQQQQPPAQHPPQGFYAPAPGQPVYHQHAQPHPGAPPPGPPQPAPGAPRGNLPAYFMQNMQRR